jgi:hypothetical protein
MNSGNRRFAWIAILALLFGPTIASASSPAFAAPLFVLADASGSMRETVEVLRRDFEGPESEADPEETLRVPKIAVVRELLVRLMAAMSEDGRTVGLYRFRYIGGDSAHYAVFLEPEPRNPGETAERIAGDFVVDYPVFNRRTGLADGLRQLDENLLSALEGPRTLLLLSDGRETFHDLERDRETALADDEPTDPDAPIRGPFTEIRRLRERYGDDLELFFVHLDRPAGEEEATPEGRRLLTDMAGSEDRPFFDGLALLKDIAPLAEAVFGGER